MSALSDSGELLAWYDRHRRSLPWRAAPGITPDPYRVWLSEVMLQQTTTGAVTPYYGRFCKRFPTLAHLAAAPESEVLTLWAGLGYYSRARNLHRAARILAARGFPREPEALAALPGIGAYTAAAIAAIAFGIPTVPVDANVARVVARRYAIAEPLPKAMPRIRNAARELGTEACAVQRPGDFAQALFDLGASVCTAREPRCAECPWQAACAARLSGTAARLPVKSPRRVRPHRFGAHFWLTDREGNILLRRRPETGPLAGMTELPGTAWRAAPWVRAEVLANAPMRAHWRAAGEVRHGFTHFTLSIALYAARVRRITAAGFVRAPGELAEEALPSVMRKCARLMLQ